MIHLSSLSSGKPETTPYGETDDSGREPAALTLEPRQQQSWAERAWWTVAGIAMLNMVIGLYGPASTFPWIGAFVVFGGAWSLGLIAVSLMQFGQSPQIRRYSDVLGWCTALLLLLLFAVWAFTQVHANPAYGTDELAFDQYAASLVQHGFNPYVHTMHPAFALFRVSPDGATYTLTGKAVNQFSYPSLAFLVYLPFLILGWSRELGIGLNVAAWGVSIVLMFGLLPRNMRAFALVIGLVDAYIANAVGGVTDVLYVPLLIITAYRWDRFGTDRRSYLGPITLGLAMAIKQTPWPLLAFLVVGIACDEYARAGLESAVRRAGRYLGVVLGAFLLPNLPFILMDPAAWVRGTLTPLVRNMVPSGQGTIALSLFLHLGGGSLFAFTVSMVFMGLLTLIAYVGTYPLMRPATFILPALVYFFASRSQTNYLIALIPVAIVGAVTVGPAPRPASEAIDGGLLEAGLTGHGWRAWLARQIGPTGPIRSMRWAQAIAVAAVLFAISTVYSLAATPPLELSITGVVINGNQQLVQVAYVTVQNTTGSRVRPHFTVEDRNGFTAFWHIDKGPQTLAPHQRAAYTLGATNSGADPALSAGFSMLAFINKPGSVSVSNRYLPELMHLVFNPQAFNTPVPVGKTLVVRVQLVGHLNAPADRAGVAVSLSQTVYTNIGHGRASAIINGHIPGGSGVVAYTNSHGIASFRIVGTHPGLLPTDFQAGLRYLHTNTHADFMYGMTGALAVTFAKAG